MRQLQLPFYRPTFPSPERAVLTLLHAALRVAEQTLRDEHPMLEAPWPGSQHHAPLVVATAKLVVGRCAELRDLVDAYDRAVDDVLQHDDSIPF
ncbi:MAG: hypothetical protein OEZ06_17470 [Myxococcales bacterium]|nr:hypothetical protein [Myxococcales bacterium]